MVPSDLLHVVQQVSQARVDPFRPVCQGVSHPA
jgi:hypothetical protein